MTLATMNEPSAGARNGPDQGQAEPAGDARSVLCTLMDAGRDGLDDALIQLIPDRGAWWANISGSRKGLGPAQIRGLIGLTIRELQDRSIPQGDHSSSPDGTSGSDEVSSPDIPSGQNNSGAGAIEGSSVRHSVSAIAEDGLDSMVASAGEITRTSHKMAEVATNTAVNVAEVSEVADAVSHDLSLIAAASQELAVTSSTVSETMDYLKAYSEEARQATDTAKGQVGQLAERAATVGEVLEIIKAIASQTNLLALNATIEAARAGEAGRGFAVVASEVKKLAADTAKATEHIHSSIEEIHESVGSVITQIDAVSEKIAGTDQSVSQANTSIGEQNAATGQIAQSVVEISDKVTKMVERLSSVASDCDLTSMYVDQTMSDVDVLTIRAGEVKTKLGEKTAAA